MADSNVKNEKEKETSGNETYSPTDSESALIEKWKKRFTRAENYLRPYRGKWLRMYKLYRAYQEKVNYAYQTRLMPPIAFQIVETVASRMVTAKRKTRVLPREKKDVDSKSIQAWDDLVNYDFDVIKLQKKLSLWIKSATTFGNGIGMVSWLTDSSIDYDDPFLTICDLWDIMPAPETEDLEEDCPWLIRRIIKSKEKIERDEKSRGDNALYQNVNFLQSKQVEDWKQERYDINIKKMGQIQSAESKAQSESVIKVTGEKYEREKMLELWECYDFEEGKLITIGNREILMRNDETPYQEVNHGRIFLNLADHEVNWEMWAIGHIEPVETTIVEIADLRNQRMDDVILMLDPVVKIRKDSGISKNDIIFAPGAKWELRKMDDVVVERLPDISLMGVNEERMLSDEIEKTLAISEYVQGMPQSAGEPVGKVAMLIGQSNLRLSTFAQNLSETLTRLANILIEMNREFIEEDKLYRVVGDEVSFKEFTSEDKEIKVDAMVAVDPAIPPDQQTRLNQVLLLYDKLVTQDKPDPANTDEFTQWKRRKRIIQEMILVEMDKEAYRAVLLGEEKSEPVQQKEQEEKAETPVASQSGTPSQALPQTQQSKPSLIRRILSRVPFIGQKLNNQ